MAAKVAADLDFLGLFATRHRLEDPVSSDPSGLGTGDQGRVWFNTTSKKWKYWDGTTAIDVVARANHTGTQLASTISDLAATVQAYSLNQFAAPTGDLSIGTHKLTNVTDPGSAQDAATKNYVDTQIAGLTSGQVTKGAVKVGAGSNISLSSPGATIDGVSMSSGDIVLLTAQTTGSQNGPYVWTGASSTLTRATNWDTSGKAVLGSYWVVEQGSHADSYALLTNDTAITLGTDTPAFTFIGGGGSVTGSAPISVSSGVVSLGIGAGLTTSGGNLVPDLGVLPKKITGIIPTSTSGIVTVSGANVTINHGLNNSAPMVVIAAYSSPYTGYSAGDIIGPGLNGFTVQDANNVTGALPAAPASNNWTYMIVG
jgi:hypothetical protein